MKLANLCLVALFTFSSTASFAKTKIKKEPKAKVEKFKNVEKDDSESADEGPRSLTSADIRGKKRLFVGPRAGLVIGGLMGFGAEGGYNMNKDLQLGLDFSYATKDLGSGDKTTSGSTVITTTAFNLTGMLITGNAKYFVANSFYVGMGLGMRSINYNLAMEDTSGNSVDITGQATSIVLVPHIGNIWTFDNGIFLGCEWVGYAAPITSSSSSTTEVKGVITTALQDLADINQALAETLGKIGTTRLLVVHLGISF